MNAGIKACVCVQYGCVQYLEMDLDAVQSMGVCALDEILSPIESMTRVYRLNLLRRSLKFLQEQKNFDPRVMAYLVAMIEARMKDAEAECYLCTRIESAYNDVVGRGVVSAATDGNPLCPS